MALLPVAVAGAGVRTGGGSGGGSGVDLVVGLGACLRRGLEGFEVVVKGASGIGCDFSIGLSFLGCPVLDLRVPS